MAKYLDYDGLATVWSKVKAADTTTLNAAKNDATSKDNALKTELNGTINGVDSKVVTLQGKVSTLETQITGLSGAMHFKGEYESLPADLSSFSAGDVILVDKKEYVCCDKDGTKHWHELGDEGSYLTKTEASNTYATKTELSGKANASHTHTIANITNLQTTLDGKQAKGNYAKTDASNTFQNEQIVKNYLQVVPTTGTDSVKINAISILRIDSRDQSETEFEMYWPTKGGTLALTSDIPSVTAITTAEINAICQ